MFIQILIAEIIASIRGSSKRKENLFNSCKNSANSLSTIAKAQDTGLITAQEAHARSEVINVGAEILKEMPDLNPKTAKPFTHIESVKWLSVQIRKIALEAKKDGIKDIELSNFYEAKIKELREANKQVTSNP
jgi:hypothetical protein